MATLTPEAWVTGLTFPECPRWHEGELWFSDMRAGVVMTAGPAGATRIAAAAPGDPGGLGFDPEGRLLVVSMEERRLLRLVDGALEPVADLSPFEAFRSNDMVVDAAGRAYIGGFGSTTWPASHPGPPT